MGRDIAADLIRVAPFLARREEWLKILATPHIKYHVIRLRFCHVGLVSHLALHCLANLCTVIGGVLLAHFRLAHVGTCLGGVLLAHLRLAP